MKLRLPPLPRMPLMPRWLVALTREGAVQTYRLRLHWQGRYELLEAVPPPGQPCIVVIERSLPFRRKLQRFPDTPKSRLALLRAAPDEFPLPAEGVLYGLGIQDHDGYLYALPRQALESLQEHQLQPAVVLVSRGLLDRADCLHTFENYLRQGPSLDLLRAGRYLPRRQLLQMQLGAALVAACMVVGWILATPDLFAGFLEWRIAPLREQGSALPRLYRTTEKMAFAQGEAAKLYASPQARLPALLAKLFATVPPGHNLRSVEIKNGVLKVTGNGTEVTEWLIGQGFPADRITVESAGSYQRFSAERPL